MKRAFSFVMAVVAMLSFALVACAPQSAEPDVDESQLKFDNSDITHMLPLFESLIRATHTGSGEYDPNDAKYVWETFYNIIGYYGYGYLSDDDKSVGIDDGSSQVSPDAAKAATKEELKMLMAACFGPDALLPDMPEGFDGFILQDDVYTIDENGVTQTQLLSVALYDYNYTAEDVCEAIISVGNDENSDEGYLFVVTLNSDESSPYPLCITKMAKHSISDVRVAN